MAMVVRWHGDPSPDLGKIWKFFGYRGGPYVLDVLIACSACGVKPQFAGTVGTFLAEDSADALLFNTMIAARVIQLDRDIISMFVKHSLRMQRIQGRAGRKKDPTFNAVAFQANLKAFAETLPAPLSQNGSAHTNIAS